MLPCTRAHLHDEEACELAIRQARASWRRSGRAVAPSAGVQFPMYILDAMGSDGSSSFQRPSAGSGTRAHEILGESLSPHVHLGNHAPRHPPHPCGHHPPPFIPHPVAGVCTVVNRLPVRQVNGFGRLSPLEAPGQCPPTGLCPPRGCFLVGGRGLLGRAAPGRHAPNCSARPHALPRPPAT